MRQSFHGRFRRLVRRVLIVAVAAAIVLRFVALGFGRGVLTARADEELLRSGVLITLTGDLNPHYAVWGHLFHYMYSALAAAWIACRSWITGIDWTASVAAAHCEPGTIILIGRAISAAAGVLTVPVTYTLARRTLNSRLAAACAALLIATLFLHVRDSHFATSDILLTLWCTASLAAVAANPIRSGWAGLFTGLALATKLLAVTLVLTFFSVLLLRVSAASPPQCRMVWPTALRHAARFLAIALLVAAATQPFLLLDPMETWFGMFGDLFNPERRPFQQGLSVTNASIIVRYYVPQALGWPVGMLAAVGGFALVRRIRVAAVAPIWIYTLWSLLAIVSVDRIFLRYLDPLLPVLCILAAHAICATARWPRNLPAVPIALAATVLAAGPSIWRDAWLLDRLRQDDTRALAGQWIEQNLPAASRIAWSGYGSIEPHLTMPWLHVPADYDRRLIALRAARGLETDVEQAIIAWKHARDVKTYWLVAFAVAAEHCEQLGYEKYPMLEHHYDVSVLEAIDRWSRALGFLRPESPRWDLMRRRVTGHIVAPPERLGALDVDCVVLTGMPCDPALIRSLEEHYEQVQHFEPGVRWEEYGNRVMYDAGDAWFLPNWGLSRVARPGPEIRVFLPR